MRNLLHRWYAGETFDERYVFSLLGPVVFDQFFLISFNFLNTALISSSGAAAISAVNMVGSVNVFLIQIFVAVGLGGTVLTAQYFGRGERQMLSKVVNGTIFGAVLVAAVIALFFGSLHNGILDLLFGSASPAVMANARLYMVGVMLSYPFEATVEGTNGCLRGIGKTKNSLQLSLAMNLSYLVFNVIFIYGLHLGVLGMLFALNLSRWLAAGLAVWMLRSHRDLFALKMVTMLHPNWAMIKKVLIVCIPFAAEGVFFNGGKILIQMMVVSLGTSSIVVYAIATSWTQMSEIIPSALGTALVPIVGQCVGRGNIADARKITRAFILTGIAAFVVVDGVMLLSFDHAILLFSPAPALVSRIFNMYLIFVGGHLLAWTISFVTPNALRAAGDGNFTTVVSLTTMWLFRVAGAYFLCIKLGWGLNGIAAIMGFEWAVRGVIFLWRFHGQKWVAKKLI
ncbi:MATE family efflux transporter [Lacticaseibacillus mingshuiensis]|uniref:Probable multidrug resistance protein NorM n=1 Tax=Lacticaseibacillus mingshuiensis TaxID=2799574 RepID=A0ABW4CIV5_9LACO|nr:MATE family efflux transporter [Lacticaseibacillus mingshuiensis]